VRRRHNQRGDTLIQFVASAAAQHFAVRHVRFAKDNVHPSKEVDMPATHDKDHVYKILELVGSSDKSIEAAIENAVGRASKTIRDMKWFEVVQTRGHIEEGKVRHYQVTLRVGFTLE